MPVDLSSLIGPAVVAAVVSGLVSWIATERKLRTDVSLAKEKTKSERDLAERKFELDRQLAQEKLALDRKQAVAARRADVAQSIIGDFYKLRDLISDARAPFVAARELQPEDGLDDDLARSGDFAPMKRLRPHREFLDGVLAKRYEAIALFGPEAGQPFTEMVRVHNEIATAVEDILRWKDQRGGVDSLLRDARKTAFRQGSDDPITARVDAAVTSIEHQLRGAASGVA